MQLLCKQSRLEQEFNLPKNEKVVLIMPIGYSAEDSNPAPAHAESESIEEIVQKL